MHCTYFANRGARHKAKLDQVFGRSLYPTLQFSVYSRRQFDCEGKGTLWDWSHPRARGIAFSHISRSTGEDRIGRKPFLYRGRGNAILTQSPERFRP
jgi:hypothetical protein